MANFRRFEQLAGLSGNSLPTTISEEQKMPIIEIKTRVNAPIETVFNLSRSIAVHLESTIRTKEKVISSHTSDLLELGDEVTWEATHFGVRQRLTAVITEFNFPNHFRDSLVAGAFKEFAHDHFFQSDQDWVLKGFDNVL